MQTADKDGSCSSSDGNTLKLYDTGTKMTTASPVRGVKYQRPEDAQKKCWGTP